MDLAGITDLVRHAASSSETDSSRQAMWQELADWLRVLKLPKTYDGVMIFPDMYVWLADPIKPREYQVLWVGSDNVWLRGYGLPIGASRCCSTKAIAKKAACEAFTAASQSEAAEAGEAR